MEDNALLPSDVVDNVTSTTTNAPLSANQGKTLNDRINNLANIGRFLAILDANAGTVSSQPAGEVGDTYQYKVGDYYRIGAAGTYTPKSTATFTIDSTSGSSNFETGSETYSIGDVIYCSNLTSTTSTWVRQASSGGGTVQDVQVDGTSILSSGIANLTSSNAPSIPLSKVSDVTATAAEVNVLDGITATTTELNYTDGVTSNIQTQLNAKVETLSDLSVTASATELNYSTGVTGNIQTQLNAKSAVSVSPSGSSSTVVEYITVDGTESKLPSGGDNAQFGTDDILEFVDGTNTPVEANPSDTATTTLTKLKVGSVTYNTGTGNVDDVKVDGTSVVTDKVAEIGLSDFSITATASELNTLDGITATTTELNYTDGVTSNIQTQLNAKISDVQVNNTSVVTSGVANIPYNQTLNITYSDNTTATLTFNGSLT